MIPGAIDLVLAGRMTISSGIDEEQLPAALDPTILMSYLNETKTNVGCILEPSSFLKRASINWEIDGSQAAAREVGARVFTVNSGCGCSVPFRNSWHTHAGCERISGGRSLSDGAPRQKIFRFLLVKPFATGDYVLLSVVLVAFFLAHKSAIGVGIYAAIIRLAFFVQSEFAFRNGSSFLLELVKHIGLQCLAIGLSTDLLRYLIADTIFANLLIFTSIALLAAPGTFLIHYFVIFSQRQGSIT
ncbi:MAG: hypothetical protein QM780_08505 [Hyphomicrobium sp.]|uniref:hypothetical protein n=1 Tax=Hyphomicrobium sp. TaxID=82 RepID=UPI0039E4F390